MRITIFTPFLYPFYVDMAKMLHDKTEVKVYTCGIYGNYPFKGLLTHRYVEVLKCIDIFGSKSLELTSLVRFTRFKPHVVIIFGVESVAGVMLYFLSRLIRACLLYTSPSPRD